MSRIEVKNVLLISNLDVLLLVACIGKVISILVDVHLGPQSALDSAGQN